MDAVVASHFDFDHYGGLIPILRDRGLKVGTLYHNGIARFDKAGKRPDAYNSSIGTTDTVDGKKRLITSFSTMQDAEKLLEIGGLQPYFRKFLEACKIAISRAGCAN